MNTCVACAERDKSCPYGWRMAIDCVYLGGRNMMNHAPTAHTLPYSTYPFFANFTYTTCNFQRKRLCLWRNFIIILCFVLCHLYLDDTIRVIPNEQTCVIHIIIHNPITILRHAESNTAGH